MNLIACYGIVCTGKKKMGGQSCIKMWSRENAVGVGVCLPLHPTLGCSFTQRRGLAEQARTPVAPRVSQSTTPTALQPLTWFGVPGPGALRGRQPRTLGVHTLSLPWPGGAGHGTTSPSLPTSAGAAEQGCGAGRAAAGATRTHADRASNGTRAQPDATGNRNLNHQRPEKENRDTEAMVQ